MAPVKNTRHTKNDTRIPRIDIPLRALDTKYDPDRLRPAVPNAFRPYVPDSCTWIDEVLRRIYGGRWHQLRRAPGRSLRLSRPKRRGKDVDDAHDCVRVAHQRRSTACSGYESAIARQPHQGAAGCRAA